MAEVVHEENEAVAEVVPKLKLLGDPKPKGLPLEKAIPPSPDLTPEEITKIQNNLRVLKEFSKDLWLQQGQIISEVWSRLQNQMQQDRTSNDNKMKTFFEDALEIGSFIVEGIALFVAPEVVVTYEAIAIVLGSTSTLLTEFGKETSESTGLNDISEYSGTHFTLNNTYYETRVDVIDYIMLNTNECRDDIFKAKNVNKLTTLRTLINVDFVSGTRSYDNWLRLAARLFRRSLVLPEIAKPNNQFLDIYFVQDVVHGPGVEHGHVYQPCAAPFNIHHSNIFVPDEHGPGTQRKKYLQPDSVGTDAIIWANNEIIHFHPGYKYVEIRGSSNTDLKGSFIKSIGDYTQAFPSSFVFPWAMSSDQIYCQKYFIMEGFAKLKDDENNPQYTLCNGEFLNWLFIDDGAGNITNVDGVAFRYDVLRSKKIGYDYDIYLHAQQISDEIVSPNYVWQTTCMDYIYGPNDSKDSNKTFHVYTGDLILTKPTPQ